MEFITITISAQTLNTIAAALREMPFKLAQPAIKEIDNQVQTHLKNTAPKPPESQE